ncbi:MAG: hypothetical protein WKF84_07695 [Pyrinomonadaceae bacterium]
MQRYKRSRRDEPEQLWETTMNPERRTLLQVKVDDAVETDQIFTVHPMGDAVRGRAAALLKKMRWMLETWISKKWIAMESVELDLASSVKECLANAKRLFWDDPCNLICLVSGAKTGMLYHIDGQYSEYFKI